MASLMLVLLAVCWFVLLFGEEPVGEPVVHRAAPPVGPQAPPAAAVGTGENEPTVQVAA